MNDDNKTTSEAIVPLVGIAAAGAAAVEAATVGAGAAPLVIAFLAMFPGAVQLVVAHAANAQRNRAGRLWRAFVHAFGADSTPAEAAGYLEAHAAEPHVYESVTAAVRAMLDAFADEAVPALGAIAAVYTREKTRPDGFFRGFARLVTDLSSSEYRQLQETVRGILAARPTGPAVVILHFIGEGAAPPRVCLATWVQGAGEKRTPICDAPDAIRLFQLIKVTALGRDNPSGYSDGGLSGPQAVIIEHDVVAKLGQYLV
jgi:hypothetical protein